MDSRLALPALLSQALVAFIIEFDNEFERRTPHRTSNHGATAGTPDAPWLVSMAMWTKFMQYIPEEGISIRELRDRVQETDQDLQRWLTRLGKWWGYLRVVPNAAKDGSKPSRAAWVVRPTAGGRKAIEAWRPLTGEIEKRWQDRFGKREIDRLREDLQAVVRQLEAGTPDSLPILGYGLWSRPEHEPPLAQGKSSPREENGLMLPSLLSKVLLAFALEFEREAEVSLAISANVVRLIGDEGVRVRDFPRLAGISKEAVAMALKLLEQRGCAAVQSEPGSRAKVIVLTAQGRRAKDTYEHLVWDIETRWRSRFGEEAVDRLRESLELLVGDEPASSPLLGGLKPYPTGWRAEFARIERLPYYPMILHRGGYPDGS